MECIRKATRLKIILTTYFGPLADNAALAAGLGADILHIDLVRAPEQVGSIAALLPNDISLSLGVVDGRNIWKNDFRQSLDIIEKAKEKLDSSRLLVATSCSLLHSPIDLDAETDDKTLPREVKRWLSFARQKVSEVVTLADLADGKGSYAAQKALHENKADSNMRGHLGTILLKSGTDTFEVKRIDKSQDFQVTHTDRSAVFAADGCSGSGDKACRAVLSSVG